MENVEGAPSTEYRNWAIDSRLDRDPKRSEFPTDLSESLRGDVIHNNSCILLANALRDSIISNIGLWKYHLLDDDDRNSELRRRLNDGENVLVLDSYPLTWCDSRPASEKWAHLASAKLHAKITEQFERGASS